MSQSGVLVATHTTTSTTLLAGLHDNKNSAVWREFDRRYRPILQGFARRLGLRTDDAADVAQEVLFQFVRDYGRGKYDRSKGRLRTWLMTIMHRRVVDHHRACGVRREKRGSSGLVNISAEADLEAAWESERKARLLAQALVELKDTSRTNEQTLKAFELYVLKHRPAEEVAETLDITVAAVYVAKNRVAERLREIVARLEALFDE